MVIDDTSARPMKLRLSGAPSASIRPQPPHQRPALSAVSGSGVSIRALSPRSRAKPRACARTVPQADPATPMSSCTIRSQFSAIFSSVTNTLSKAIAGARPSQRSASTCTPSRNITGAAPSVIAR